MKTPDLLANPQFRTFIENFGTLSRASQQLSFQEARKLSTEFFLAPGTVFEKIKRIENVDILGPDQNRIPIRFFFLKRMDHCLCLYIFIEEDRFLAILKRPILFAVNSLIT